MAYFVNIQSPLHLETSLLAVYRNLEMQVLGRNMWSSSVSQVAFSIESRPSNIDQTLIVACCPLIQLVSSLLRSEDLRTTHTAPEPEENVTILTRDNT